jgi:type II secretory pathway pseudopilin PulG
MTLIEVMVAGSILSIVLTTTATALVFGFTTTGRARRAAAAERIAAGHLEMLVLENRLRTVPPSGSIRFNLEGQTDPAGAFTSTWSLDPNRPVPGASRLAVDVRWEDGGTRSSRLVTYLSAGGRP